MKSPSTRLKKRSLSTKSPTRQWRRLARGLRSRGCGRSFAPAALSAIGCLHSSNEKPRPGETGALRTEGGWGYRGSFHPTKILSLFKLTEALPLAPLHSAAKDRRAPLVARRG